MNKKILKTMGVLAPLTVIGTSLVSCSFSKDSENDNQIQFVHSFKEDGIQAKALKEIADVWNSREEVKSGKEMKIVIRKSSSIISVREELQQKLAVRDTKNLYNISLSYPALIPLLQKYNRTLDLKDVSPQEKIQSQYLNFNKRILNKKNNEEVLAVASNRSGEILSINKVVLAYLLKKLQSSQGGLFTISNDEKTTKFMKELQFEESKEDFKVIQKIWKEPTENVLTQPFTFSYSIFDSYLEVFKFSELINNVFKQSKNSDNIKEKSFGVLGIDSMTNPIYSMFFSVVKGDYNKFLLNSKDGKSIDYKRIFNPNSEEFITLKNIFNQISSTLKSGSVYIRDKDKYSSNYLKNHQLVFAFGSTAGYKYSFVKEKNIIDITNEENIKDKTPEEIEKIKTQNKINSEENTKTMGENEQFIKLAPKFFQNDNGFSSIITQGPSLIGIKTTSEKDKNTINFIKWFLNSKSMKLENQEELVTPLEYFGKKGGYVIPTKDLFKLSDEEIKTKFNKAEQVYLLSVKEQITNNENFEFFEDPVDINSETFRNSLDNNITAFIQRSKSGNKNESFEEFMKNFQDALGSSFK